MKISPLMQTSMALTILLSLLISPLSAVVLLRGNTTPTKQVKKRESFPKLNFAHNESDKLRINGWRMSPSDVSRIHNEGRRLNLVCKKTLYKVQKTISYKNTNFYEGRNINI